LLTRTLLVSRLLQFIIQLLQLPPLAQLQPCVLAQCLPASSTSKKTNVHEVMRDVMHEVMHTKMQIITDRARRRVLPGLLPGLLAGHKANKQ
jgi:hypothetical protein